MSCQISNPYSAPNAPSSSDGVPAASFLGAIFAYAVLLVDSLLCTFVFLFALYSSSDDSKWTLMDVLEATSVIAPAMVAMICNTIVLFIPRISRRAGSFSAVFSVVIAVVMIGIAFIGQYVRPSSFQSDALFWLSMLALARLIWNLVYLFALGLLNRYREAIAMRKAVGR